MPQPPPKKPQQYPAGFTPDPVQSPKYPAGFTPDPVQSGFTPDATGQGTTPTGQTQGSLGGHSLMGDLSSLGNGALDAYTGAAKGAVGTAAHIGHLLFPDALARGLGMKPPTPGVENSYFAPKNSAESFGKGVEQTGEFFLPGDAEAMGASKLASLAPKLGKFAAPFSRVATGALSNGLVNEAQGGNFSTGAETGAVLGAGGEGLKIIAGRLAPALAEDSLNIGKNQRGWGRSGGRIGRAVLDETSGFAPETVAKSAQKRVGELSEDMDRGLLLKSVPSNAVNKSALMDQLRRGGGLDEAIPGVRPQRSQYNNSVDMIPLRDQADANIAEAIQHNMDSGVAQLTPQSDFMYSKIRATGGLPMTERVGMSDNITPFELQRYKQGFGKEFSNWNPDRSDYATGKAQELYHAMDDTLDAIHPKGKAANDLMSKLIPVINAGKSTARNAPVESLLLKSMRAPTGALLGALEGGGAGYHFGGLPGAAVGALGGAVVPKLLATPTAVMGAARLLNGAGKTMPTFLRTVGGMGLNGFDRNTDEVIDNRKKNGNQ